MLRGVRPGGRTPVAAALPRFSLQIPEADEIRDRLAGLATDAGPVQQAY